MRILPLFLLCTVATLLSSCSKEDKIRHKLSGVYEVTKYERIYYNGHTTADSTRTIDDFGKIGMNDNDVNPFNLTVRNLKDLPESWSDNNVGSNNMDVKWYGDDVNGKTVTFFSDDGYETYYIIYTITKEGRKKYKWSYVGMDSNGNQRYTETLYVTKE